MGHETEWFSGDSVEKAHVRCYWRRIGFAVFAALAAALLLFPLLTGCASAEPEKRVCFVQRLGMTEEGLTVVAQLCMTPEAFAETQKR